MKYDVTWADGIEAEAIARCGKYGNVVPVPEHYSEYLWAKNPDVVWIIWEKYTEPTWCSKTEVKFL